MRAHDGDSRHQSHPPCPCGTRTRPCGTRTRPQLLTSPQPYPEPFLHVCGRHVRQPGLKPPRIEARVALDTASELSLDLRAREAAGRGRTG